MRFFYLIFTLLFFFSLHSSHLLQAADLPTGFVEVQIATGLDPTSMALAPDGRVFIAEKNGRILIVEDGELLPEPFLVLDLDNSNERGLSGIVFDPNFEENNYLYIYYTVLGENHNRVSRITANGNLALAGSEVVLLELDELLGSVHNGGAMEFGADGTLFIATGEGSQPSNSQNTNTLLGKILRINSDGSIPTDNPFYAELEGKYRAIWALGFRNPFSMAIEHSTNRIFACDVGGFLFEEVNAVEKGGNYGWSILEGFRTNQEVPENYRDPLYAYSHGLGCSVIGAAFYSPSNKTFPEQYHDKFFFGDYCKGYIKVLNPQTGVVEQTFATGVHRPLNFKVTPEGDFYYLERAGLGGGSQEDNTSSWNGALWKISYTGNNAPFISVQPRSVLLPIGEEAIFSVKAAGGQPLSYQWQRNEVDIEGAIADTYMVSDLTLEDNGSVFRCKVSNNLGEVISEEALLTVTSNTRPTPTIVSPLSTTTYQAGQVIVFEGKAIDLEDGELEAANFRWKIDFHHDEHKHPALQPTIGIMGGEYQTANVGETSANVWYRIYLTATDSEGLTKTTFTDVFPETVNITLTSEPTGLSINLDGQFVPLPHTFESVKGIERNLSAPFSQELDGKLYAFRQWENEDADRLNSFFTPQKDSTLQVEYEYVPFSDGDGLMGNYYNGNLGDLDSTAHWTNLDPFIDFDWGIGSPNELINDENFQVRWLGWVEPLFSEEYTFHVISDDGTRLFVDDFLIIDGWMSHPALETTGRITLEAGKKYPIRLEYFDSGGNASIQLFWSGLHTPKQIVRTSQLFSEFSIDIDNPEKLPFVVNWFPNPVSDVLTLSIIALEAETVEVTWYDLVGREITSKKVNILPQKTEVTWEMATFPKGVYIVEVKGNQVVESRAKIVVD
ncbi:MAG: PQQ-dependent sugar dehydrogenase [Chitinophagales bacterium]